MSLRQLSSYLLVAKNRAQTARPRSFSFSFGRCLGQSCLLPPAAVNVAATVHVAPDAVNAAFAVVNAAPAAVNVVAAAVSVAPATVIYC